MFYFTVIIIAVCLIFLFVFVRAGRQLSHMHDTIFIMGADPRIGRIDYYETIFRSIIADSITQTQRTVHDLKTGVSLSLLVVMIGWMCDVHSLVCAFTVLTSTLGVLCLYLYTTFHRALIRRFDSFSEIQTAQIQENDDGTRNSS